MSTLGHILKAEREKRGETPSEVAAQTHIKVQHIEALERNDFSRIAAAAYAKGFIKLYAEHLGLDPAPLLEEYVEQHARRDPAPTLRTEDVPEPEEDEEGEPGPSLGAQLLEGLLGLPWPRIIVVVAVIVAAWFGLAGLGHVAKGLLQGPEQVETAGPGAAPPHSLLEPPPEPYLDPADLEHAR